MRDRKRLGSRQGYLSFLSFLHRRERPLLPGKVGFGQFFIFSADINLTLGLLPHRRQVVWLDSVGVETSRSGLKIRVRGYFSSELSLLLRHTDEPQLKRAKQLSMAAIPLCFEFFRCRVSTISIAVFCLQNLICLQK